MNNDKEIKALLNLLDDPDEEIYAVVSEKIANYGKEIIPNLENAWENTINSELQQRIESLIHRLHFSDLEQQFTHWSNEEYPLLLDGVILTCKYLYPDLDSDQLLKEIEKLKKSIWLELNNYLTPLEQVNILASILFNYFGLKGVEKSKSGKEGYLFNKVIESKKGNQFGNGLLFLVLAEQLNLPISAIQIPGLFALAYFRDDIQYYIDPGFGHIFTQKDVDTYFERVRAEAKESYFLPLDTFGVIKTWLIEFSTCFENIEESDKKKELLQLVSILDKQK
jgi:hypothetical protein